jgi:catechol 2,3-dioxygenase-like lactoylglutathione lyase family enzyme
MRGLHHVGIYTNPLDESLAFYRSVIEFQEQWRGSEGGTGASQWLRQV